MSNNSMTKILDKVKFLDKVKILPNNNATPPSPTYSLSRSVTSVDEGSSVTFTLATTGVANGTSVPYTITGVSAIDITSGLLTDSFIINNGSATTTITMLADQLTEGAETATLTLNNGAASNFVVVNDTSTSISANAAAYIAAVEAADGQSLEPSIKTAFTNFIGGLEADGIYSAIKACCIMAGARTLQGALVPLVGPAPTNLNFVSGDYDRKTGLKGNGTSKYLNTNFDSTTSPLTELNYHQSVYATEDATGNSRALLGHSAGSDYSHIVIRSSGLGATIVRNRSNDSNYLPGNPRTGFLGSSRTGLVKNWTMRGDSTSYGATTTNNAYAVSAYEYVFWANNIGSRTSSRMTWYSFGANIDLSLLDTRVSALMAALNTAI